MGCQSCEPEVPVAERLERLGQEDDDKQQEGPSNRDWTCALARGRDTFVGDDVDEVAVAHVL